MGILNTAEVRPGIIAVLCKFLLSNDCSYDEGKIQTLIEPQGIATKSSEFAQTVKEAETLKIIERKDGRITLSEPFSTDLDSDFDNAKFVNLMRKQVLDESVNTKKTEKWASQLGARELTNALAFYMSIPYKKLPSGYDEYTALQQEFFGSATPFDDEDGGKVSNWPFTNRARLPAFRHWMVFLGFGWVSPKGILIPDPGVGIRSILEDLFSEEKTLTASDFRKRLGKQIPILEEGKYRKFVESNYTEEKQTALKSNSKQFSQATSMALRTLETRDTLKFHKPDDGKTPALQLFDGETISRIEYKK